MLWELELFQLRKLYFIGVWIVLTSVKWMGATCKKHVEDDTR